MFVRLLKDCLLFISGVNIMYYFSENVGVGLDHILQVDLLARFLSPAPLMLPVFQRHYCTRFESK